jgi:LmbE family N-acetylglucosaminyl deacetylase
MYATAVGLLIKGLKSDELASTNTATDANGKEDKREGREKIINKENSAFLGKVKNFLHDWSLPIFVRLMRQDRPHVVTCYNEKGGYGHPDHIRVNQTTVAAFHAAGDATQYPDIGLEPWQPRKLYYTSHPRSYILTRYEVMRSMGNATPLDRPDFDPNRVGTPDERITTRINIRPYVRQKVDALRCHRTQVAPDWWYFGIPTDVLEEKFSEESFIRMASHVDVTEREDDLFAGLR